MEGCCAEERPSLRNPLTGGPMYLSLATHLPLVPGLDPAVFTAAEEPRLSLFWGARTPTHVLLAMFTWLAFRGKAPRVFDGGNRFDGYFGPDGSPHEPQARSCPGPPAPSGCSRPPE